MINIFVYSDYLYTYSIWLLWRFGLACFFSQNNSWRIVPSENSKDIFFWKLTQDNWRIHRRSFFISHLSKLVISPLHNIPNVQKSDAMSIPTGDLINQNLLFFAKSLQDKIGKSFNFGDISHMPNLSNTQLSFQITAKSMNLIRLTQLISWNY